MPRNQKEEMRDQGVGDPRDTLAKDLHVPPCQEPFSSCSSTIWVTYGAIQWPDLWEAPFVNREQAAAGLEQLNEHTTVHVSSLSEWRNKICTTQKRNKICPQRKQKHNEQLHYSILCTIYIIIKTNQCPAVWKLPKCPSWHIWSM